MTLKHNGKAVLGSPLERVIYTKFMHNQKSVVTKAVQGGMAASSFEYSHQGHRVDRNRDHITDWFMAHKEAPDWLLMLDSDMEHPIDVLERLMRWEQPIVGALYFHRMNYEPMAFFESGKREPDQYGVMRDTWIPIRDQVFSFLEGINAPIYDGALSIGDASERMEGALVAVDAIGTGAILIHRSVFEAMPPPWWRYRDGNSSEDLQFCYAAKRLGFPIHVDLTTICGHFAEVAVGQAQFRQKYLKGGYDQASFTLAQAITGVARYLDEPEDIVARAINNYKPDQLAALWQDVDMGDPEAVRCFYTSEPTGRLYLYDLANWNTSAYFKSLQQQLIGIRNQRIIEVGGGIGTLAIQLANQSNEVVCVEPNDFLRTFAQDRWEAILVNSGIAKGTITFVSDISEVEGEAYDFAVALDTFEHLHALELQHTLALLGARLRHKARLFAHNNWRQQDIYPMHYDHSSVWESLLESAGFVSINDLWNMKI